MQAMLQSEHTKHVGVEVSKRELTLRMTSMAWGLRGPKMFKKSRSKLDTEMRT